MPARTYSALNAQLIMPGDGKALKRAVNYVMSHAGTLAMIPALGYVAVSALWAAFRLGVNTLHGAQAAWARASSARSIYRTSNFERHGKVQSAYDSADAARTAPTLLGVADITSCSGPAEPVFVMHHAIEGI